MHSEQKCLTLLVWFLLGRFVFSDGESVMLRQPKNMCSQKNSTEVGETVRPVCQDMNENCEEWAEEGECRVNEGYMLLYCPCSCNSCPTYSKSEWDDQAQIAMGPLKEEIEYFIQKTAEYMVNYIKYYSNRIGKCSNKHAGCSHWALLGECHFNPAFMLEDCAAACRVCHISRKRKKKNAAPSSTEHRNSEGYRVIWK